MNIDDRVDHHRVVVIAFRARSTANPSASKSHSNRIGDHRFIFDERALTELSPSWPIRECFPNDSQRSLKVPQGSASTTSSR